MKLSTVDCTKKTGFLATLTRVKSTECYTEIILLQGTRLEMLRNVLLRVLTLFLLSSRFISILNRRVKFCVCTHVLLIEPQNRRVGCRVVK